jgi:hypothetical protein
MDWHPRLSFRMTWPRAVASGYQRMRQVIIGEYILR